MESNKETLPGAKLSDVEALRYFFEKYLFTVENGKPSQRAANILKEYIDIVQKKKR
jgi:hypothetical protein